MVADRFPPHPTGRVIPPAGPGPLLARAEELHAAALAALTGPDQARGFQAIARLTGHLAATRRAVLPVAARQAGTGAWLVAACRAQAGQAERALRRYGCLLAGQSRAVRLPPGSVWAQLEQRLAGYRAAEQVLLTRLDACLSAAEQTRLAAAYRAVFAAAPTRPHPRCPHTGPLAGPAFRVLALRDRFLDAIDSRPARPPPADPGGEPYPP